MSEVQDPAAREYGQGHADGYTAAIKDVQAEFTPLWQAVQRAVGRSHALDSFIIERRRSAGAISYEAEAVRLLREIAGHVEAGREFRRGEWVKVGPVDGLGIYPFRRGRRRAWVEGVKISHEVIAQQLRDVADDLAANSGTPHLDPHPAN